MTRGEAGRIALEFLAASGIRDVQPVTIESICDGLGYLVSYNHVRAIAGEFLYQMHGNLPIVVDANDKVAAQCGSFHDYRDASKAWLRDNALRRNSSS